MAVYRAELVCGGGGGCLVFFFFKQKTAYEIYQCDWSSDVCSSDLAGSPAEIVRNETVKKLYLGNTFAGNEFDEK